MEQRWWEVSCPELTCRNHEGVHVLAPAGENYVCAACGLTMDQIWLQVLKTS